LLGSSQADSPAVTLAPGAQYDGTAVIHMLDASGNQDGCKNASVPLYLAAG